MTGDPAGGVDSSTAGRPVTPGYEHGEHVTAARDDVEPPRERRTPVRTCVGCRGTGSRSELVRVVVVEGVLVPDPRARIAGRGAWLHPDPACLDLAVKRRALPRALRVPAPLDVDAVRAEIERLAARTTAAPSAEPPGPA